MRGSGLKCGPAAADVMTMGHRVGNGARRRLLAAGAILIATTGAIALTGGAAPASAATAGPATPTAPSTTALGTPVAAGVRPHDFWLTSTQAIAIAARQPALRGLARQPGVQAHPLVAGLGLWAIAFERAGRVVKVVRVEDRTHDVLEPTQSDSPTVGSKLD